MRLRGERAAILVRVTVVRTEVSTRTHLRRYPFDQRLCLRPQPRKAPQCVAKKMRVEVHAHADYPAELIDQHDKLLETIQLLAVPETMGEERYRFGFCERFKSIYRNIRPVRARVRVFMNRQNGARYRQIVI